MKNYSIRVNSTIQTSQRSSTSRPSQETSSPNRLLHHYRMLEQRFVPVATICTLDGNVPFLPSACTLRRMMAHRVSPQPRVPRQRRSSGCQAQLAPPCLGHRFHSASWSAYGWRTGPELTTIACNHNIVHQLRKSYPTRT